MSKRSQRIGRRDLFKASAGIMGGALMSREAAAEQAPQRNVTTNSVEKPVINKGFIKVPDKPGLGITLNEEVVRRHLAPGTGYFDPTPQWNQERSADWTWS